MKLEFNIRLDSAMSPRCAFKLVAPTIALIRDTFKPKALDYVYTQRQAESERYNMLELQEILVVRVDTDVPMLVVHQVMYSICMTLHQACVAMFVPSHGKGVLLGPDTAAFAPFDSSKFIMYGEVAV